jgi:hypothetical protein
MVALVVTKGLVHRVGVVVFRTAVHLPLTGADFKDRGPFLLRNHPIPFGATYVEDLTPTRTIMALPRALSLTTMENGLIKCLATRSSASPSTSVPLAVDGVQCVTTATPALCVVTCHMDVRDALLDTIFPIVTKLKPNAWELALANAGILNQFNDIPVGLREGFYCGLENYSLSCTSIPPNHFTSKEDEAFIVSKYAEEITLGRISHGYDPHELFSLIGHFRRAPLTVITRNGKRRVIVNHSFPHTNKTCILLDNQPQNTSSKIIIDPTQTSINTVIDSKKFQCAWGSFSECYLLVADATEGTQAAIFDVDSAFRKSPPILHLILFLPLCSRSVFILTMFSILALLPLQASLVGWLML